MTTTPNASPPGRVFTHDEDDKRAVLDAPQADPAVHERMACALADPFAFAVAILQNTAIHRPEPPPTAPAPAPPKPRTAPKARTAQEVLKLRDHPFNKPMGPLSGEA